eukprot:TRINITY_DN5111_c0_g1_i8.p1 TRINITY_DN5111_c0_g1~~TRINITY_DN5111_c0_g1_i8.p1  ORF type:complete len:352 (+),score=60.29 TRINITY_DN5111_c0_g1_i8:379-1434(+)
MNINRIFSDIMTQDEPLLDIIRHIVVSGAKALDEKKALLKRRWHSLKTTNLSEEEYRQKEKELQRTEAQEVSELKEDIFNRLCSSKIKGFESRETFLENIKRNYRMRNNLNEDVEVEFDEKELKVIKEDQMAIVDMLLNEKHLNKPDAIKIQPSSQRPDKFMGYNDHNHMSNGFTNGSGHHPGNHGQGYHRMDIEGDRIYHNGGEGFADGDKPEGLKKSIIGQINKAITGSDLIESVLLENLKNSNFFQVGDNDVIQMSKHEMRNITDQKLNKWVLDYEKYDHLCEVYARDMQDLYREGRLDSGEINEKAIHELMKMTSFAMNGVHFYQKFKDIDLKVNPYDILFLLSHYR